MQGVGNREGGWGSEKRWGGGRGEEIYKIDGLELHPSSA